MTVLLLILSSIFSTLSLSLLSADRGYTRVAAYRYCKLPTGTVSCLQVLKAAYRY